MKARKGQKHWGWRVNTMRVVFPALLTVLIFIATTFFIVLPSLHTYLVNSKKSLIKELTYAMVDMLQIHVANVANGSETLEAAQSMAKKHIEGFRYGSSGKNYFWVIDMDGVMLAHPYRKDIINTNVYDMQDVHGKFLIRDFIDIVHTQGEGYAEYMWQWQDDPTIVIQKISYVKKFAPWGWIVGTGLYVDEVEREMAVISKKLTRIFSGMLICILFLLGYIVVYEKLAEDQRRKTARQQRNSERKFSILMEQSPVAIALYDLNGFRVQVNQAWLRMWRVSPEDAKKEFNLLTDQQIQGLPIYALIKQAFAGEGTFIHDWTFDPAKSGFPGRARVMRSCIYPIRDDDGELLNVVLMDEDITAREQAAHDLRKSEENLAITLNSIGDAVIATDAGGYVVRMNPVAEQLTGWSFALAKGKKLPEVFKISNGRTRERIENPVDKVMRLGDIVELEHNTILQGKDGIERRISDSGAPIRNAQGDIVGVVLVFRDVTERHQMEAQLRQSQKMDSIGKLAGGIAHDFNNMLSGIMGAAELLTSSLRDDTKSQTYVSIIRDAASQAAALTSKLLAFSRKGKSISAPFDLHAAIDSSIALLEHSIDRKIKISQLLNAEQTIINGDPVQVQNAILNLGLNAAAAMPAGGVLTLETNNRYLNEHECRVSGFSVHPGPHIELRVSDTGVGMNDSLLTYIFEPFFTTKDIGGGTGLGLAAVYGTVKEHYGSIIVESVEGKGSMFTLCFPLIKKALQTPVVHPEHLEHGTGRILVVDDEAIVRMTTAAILRSLGYSVTLAVNGKDAVEVYEKEKDTIDLVILDLVMPEMNGEDAFAVLKQINPDVKVILTSGFKRDMSTVELLWDGAASFIHKPYQRVDLAHHVAKALGKDMEQ